MISGLDMGRADHVDPPGIDDDQFRALAQPALHPAGEDRMAVRRVGADHDHHVGLLDRVEILGAGRGAEGGLQAVAGRRMADAGAGIDIVVAEAGADQFLDEEGLLVGAARRGDAADRAIAVGRLQPAEFRRGVANRLLPAHLLPGFFDRGADHRLEDALLMGRIAPGEAALDAAVAAIGLAVLPGDHADDLLALHLRLEGAADAAIGAGGDRAGLGQADRLDRLLLQRTGRAGGHAGAARNAFGSEERLLLARRDV